MFLLPAHTKFLGGGRGEGGTLIYVMCMYVMSLCDVTPKLCACIALVVK